MGKEKQEAILRSTAKFFYNVFSDKYDDWFENKLVSGGGGNSMFVNAWVHPSAKFIRYRISSEAIKRLEEHNYSLEKFVKGKVPKSFISNNAKGAANRIKAGKHIHGDHNPGNVKVLNLIRDEVRSYKRGPFCKRKNVAELMKFISNLQTLDIITVEQDDKRTYADDAMPKSEKDMLSASERDALLDDTWKPIDPKNKSVY
jgi:hypothetical protein